jgi:hypothetical protein
LVEGVFEHEQTAAAHCVEAEILVADVVPRRIVTRQRIPLNEQDVLEIEQRVGQHDAPPQGEQPPAELVAQLRLADRRPHRLVLQPDELRLQRRQGRVLWRDHPLKLLDQRRSAAQQDVQRIAVGGGDQRGGVHHLRPDPLPVFASGRILGEGRQFAADGVDASLGFVHWRILRRVFFRPGRPTLVLEPGVGPRGMIAVRGRIAAGRRDDQLHPLDAPHIHVDVHAGIAAAYQSALPQQTPIAVDPELDGAAVGSDLVVHADRGQKPCRRAVCFHRDSRRGMHAHPVRKPPPADRDRPPLDRQIHAHRIPRTGDRRQIQLIQADLGGHRRTPGQKQARPECHHTAHRASPFRQ